MLAAQQQQQQTQLSMKQPTNYLPYNTQNPNPNPNPCHKPKTQLTQMTNSDEDEQATANDHENTSMEGKRKGSDNMSPWQRMKWTDNMVRLLIMAVYYIGDEAGNEIGPEKKKPGPGGSGLLQKKGKWKSVSRAMMEKGFYVSPQQCEDKFNDLNKRYKRVNDILGKGTACRVVENQTLLESMDLSPKMKEEVRKLLNSKHLFFREMCAYHNSCGHGSTNPNSIGDQQQNPQNISHQNMQNQQQSCHHSEPSSMEIGAHKLGLGSEDHEDDDLDDDDEDEEDEDEFEDEEQEHEERVGPLRKKARGNLEALQQLNREVMGMLQDGNRSSMEKKQWVMTQLVQLEEQGLRFQFQALELEKQRLKWIRFSSKKEREMEKMKIDNERKRLENERMVLLLRQKEIELINEPQHQSQRQLQHTPPTNPSCLTA